MFIPLAEAISSSDNFRSMLWMMYSLFVELAPVDFTTKSSGTGLGLAMCKRIVEQSQGEIWYETQEGTGTTFFVRLPLQTPA